MRKQVSAYFSKGTRKRRRQCSHVLIIVGVGLLFSALVVIIRPFASFEWRLEDLLFLPTSPSTNIIIAAIDDETLEKYGKWSEWPRSLHAQAIQNLSDAKAMAIGFDVLFAGDSADDAILGQSIAEADSVVLAVAGSQRVSSSESGIVFQNILHPVPALESAAVAVGHGNVLPDGDGVVRGLPLVISNVDGQSFPALIVSLLYTHFSQALPVEYQIRGGFMHLIGREIPVDENGSMRINFIGPGNSFPHVSYTDVIEGSFDPELVRFRIVLVGMTATGEPDSWVTPVSADKMYGVEIHANAVDTILRQRFLTETAWSTTLITLLAMVVGSALVLPFLSLRWGGLLTGLAFFGYTVAVFLTFENGHIMNIIYPLTALPLVYATVVLCRVAAEQSDKSLVKGLFGRYVSHQVAEKLVSLADKDELKLGGEEREVSVLFADLRGFTNLSEQMKPEAVVTVLNAYLSAIIQRVLANDGMVNKFAGDSIMAVWNAPQDQSDHALLAVKAAFESQEAVANVQRKDSSLPIVQFGMGINTGQAIAGNVGSEGRSEYTVIGDTVNVASRLCSNAPGGQVWIGPLVYERVKGEVEVQELGFHRLKGKSEPIEVYRVVGILPPA